MAFFYEINGKVLKFFDEFHFWYVNGYHSDPKLRQEVLEDRPVKTIEGKITYSVHPVEGKVRSWCR